MLGQPPMQDIIYNTAVLSAGGTLLGAVVVFILLYMLLERKKKELIAAFVVVLIGFGGFYWFMGRKPVAPLDAPKVVKTEAIKPPQVQPTPVPLPKPRPRVKKAAKPVGPPLKICP